MLNALGARNACEYVFVLMCDDALIVCVYACVHSRQLNFSKKKWAVLSAVELFALHLRCCSSMIHACVCLFVCVCIPPSVCIILHYILILQ